MDEEIFEKKEQSTIFIKITLYLLLAFAFFSDYWVTNEDVSAIGLLIFIFGVFTLIPLTIIYIERGKRIWSYFSITPFILIILISFGNLYIVKLGKGVIGGFWEFFNAYTIRIIFLLMIIFLVVIGIEHIIKSKK